MNFLDITLIIITVIFLARGFFRGLVKEIISLVSIGLAYFMASRYHEVLSPHLKVYLSSETTIRALSYVLIFFGVLLICWVLAKIIRQFLELALLGWLDRSAGAVFGAAEGALLCLLLLLLLQSFMPDAQFLRDSQIVPHVQPAVDKLADFTPSDVRSTLRGKGINLPTPESIREKADAAVGVIEETVTNNGDQ
ncbi:CvpA family protein [Pseudodesulfovibrio senegalensis]|jgi:membrane protein required for colicin V production|uniref:CvpA family protein n=1 Tax=Pseudodesulfovibrio senegalensis TaxID=1721087 RepID=A0A6N6N161_9BACT|nr:CvpA family protein [Pseudodesulfovibrio senegalensis]KAB1440283.1 CvpA family protein [Pseudodesulfovibrio senegalensis]